jgi:hypothetical protein
MRNQHQHPMDDAALFPPSAAEQICTKLPVQIQMVQIYCKSTVIQTKPSPNKGFGFLEQTADHFKFRRDGLLGEIQFQLI